MADGLAALPASWPFVEARKILARAAIVTQEDERPYVLQTGYGPSGLPHIGTFGEVARTSMVRRALSEMTDRPSRLICFSDDLDALRKVPDNVPKGEMLEEHIGWPLSRVPDPFGCCDSFAAHNNARLQAFLDGFGFEYEFVSSTERYKSGSFDEMLLQVLERYDDVQAVMLPTLRAERRATYSPFLPISPKTGRVLQTPIVERDGGRGTIVFVDEDGAKEEVPVTGGNAKLQWKPDWAMRWVALGVDYEMYGKDLIDSARDSAAIALALGGRQPEGFVYEHFLDAEGMKISKSRGNGISIEQWLAYASPESLAYFMYPNPTRARRLHLDAIVAAVEDYQRELAAWQELAEEKRPDSALWHVHAGQVPACQAGPGFRTIINLAAVTGAVDAESLWKFIERRDRVPRRGTRSDFDSMVEHAAAYARDVVVPSRVWHVPSDKEVASLRSLREALVAHAGPDDAATLQNLVYEVGKATGMPLRDWFRLLYRTLLGQDSGPRFGGFAAVYGVNETVTLLDRAINGELARQAATTEST